METTEKEVKQWYKRGWEHLTRRQQGSAVAWWARALIVLTLMFTGFAWWVLPTTYAITHQIFVWCMVGLTALIAVRFIYKTRRRAPDRADNLVEKIVGHVSRNWLLYPGDARSIGIRWRRFLLTNLLIAAVVSSHGWYVWFYHWASQYNWVAIGKTVGEIVLFLFLVGVGCGVLWVAWNGVQRIKATFGRRAPYEQEISHLRRELADEQRAHAQLCKVVPMVGQCLATGIVLIRLGKGKPQSEQNRLLVDARIVLQNALRVLVTDETTRDAMLERSRRVAEGEDKIHLGVPPNPSQA